MHLDKNYIHPPPWCTIPVSKKEIQKTVRSTILQQEVGISDVHIIYHKLPTHLYAECNLLLLYITAITNGEKITWHPGILDDLLNLEPCQKTLPLAAWKHFTITIMHIANGPQLNTTHKIGINWSASTPEPNMATVTVLCVLYIFLCIYPTEMMHASKQEVCFWEKIVSL